MGAGSGRQRLVEDDDDLAFGVPFAEIPQRFEHLIQPVAAVDDDGDLSRLAGRTPQRRAPLRSRRSKASVTRHNRRG